MCPDKGGEGVRAADSHCHLKHFFGEIVLVLFLDHLQTRVGESSSKRVHTPEDEKWWLHAEYT